MRIDEAIREAKKTSVGIARANIEGENTYRTTKIMPTNSYANCIICTLDQNGKEILRCKNWNPSAEDLTADDWILTD